MTLQRIGKRRFDWPVDQLREMIALGMTHQQIGDELGVSPKQVSAACARFGIQSQRRGPRSGPGHPRWTGGRRIDKGGYISIWVDKDHPMVSMVRARTLSNGAGYGYIPEHRLVMALHLGRPLLSSEVVHHKNGIHDDNRLENLELYVSNAEHLASELKGHCPKWSEDGQQRILAGVRGYWSNRKAQEQGDPQSNQNAAHLLDEHGEWLLGLS